jgi:hypothetical protein
MRTAIEEIDVVHNEPDSEDFFEDTYFFFLDALHTALLSTTDQLKKMGGLGPGFAWELREDLCNHGTELLTLYSDRLSREECEHISCYVASSRELPHHVFEPTGEGLLAAEWSEHRKRTADVLRALEPRAREIYARLSVDLGWFEALVE